MRSQSIQVPLKRVRDNPWNTRQSYDADYIKTLARDIIANGLLQEVTGRIVDGIGRHKAPGPGSIIDDFVLDTQQEFDRTFREYQGLGVQIAFGHNRRRALEFITEWVKAGELEEDDLPDGLLAGCVPVRLRPISDEQMADHAWSENYKRKDLSPIEEALAIEQRMQDFEYTQAECAEHLGIGRSTVANKLRLLKLPEEVQQLLSDGEISERAAQALVPAFDLTEDEEERYHEHQESKPLLRDSRDVLIEDAVRGISSEQLRRNVENVLSHVRNDGEDAAESDSEVPEEPQPETESDSTSPAPYVSTSADFPEAEDEAEMDEPVEPATSVAEPPHDDGAEISAQAGWPEPDLDPVWEELPDMTKAELEETYRDFRHEQWARYGPNFRTSALKEEQLEHVRRQLRFHANLEAVHLLSEEQTWQLLRWMRDNVGDRHAAVTDSDLYAARTIFSSVRDTEELGIMDAEALQRFRLRETRRAGAFCYHLFYEELAPDEDPDEPPTCNMLRQLYDQALGMPGPDASRALKSIRSDIGRRQGVTEDGRELDRLSELHADVDHALEELATPEISGDEDAVPA